MKYDLKVLTELIKEWSCNRLLNGEDYRLQLNKLIEEVGELANGVNKNNMEQIKDSVGDIYVVLTIFCQQLDISIEQCIGDAYEEIKERKGRIVNGMFVKEEDIKEV